MPRPLITIGIAAFNAAVTIERAIQSALAQTWRPLDIVVVDDGSSDDTVRLVHSLSVDHTEIRVFQNNINSGVAVTRNRIVAEARGEFVAFFDDDDESAPNRIDMQLDRIVSYERDFAHGASVICHTARRQIYPDGTIRVAPTMGAGEGRVAPAGAQVAERILIGTPVQDGDGGCPTCSQMARLSTYRALGGFDPNLRRSEDTDLNIRLALAGGHFAGVATPLVTQFMSRTSDKTLADEYKYALMVIEKHCDIINHYGNYDFVRRWLELKQSWLEGRRGTFGWSLAKLIARYPRESVRRLVSAVPNIGLNKAFRNFHLKSAL